MSYRIVLLVIGVAAAVIGLFLFLWEGGVAWLIHAQAPSAIGGYGDNMCYDGHNVRPINGTLMLRIASDGTGTLDLSVTTTDKSGPLRISASDEISGTITISAHLDNTSHINQAVKIHGDTKNGGPSLPQTFALITGEGAFDLYVNGALHYRGLRGEWSVADAVRKNDGSIRQSGLVYSPLLRDKTGFSDPTHQEFTLLIHSETADAGNKPAYDLVLQLVFSDVTIEKQPNTAAQ